MPQFISDHQRQPRRRLPTRRRLYLALAILLPVSASGASPDPLGPVSPAGQVSFNSSFIRSNGGGIDLSLFERGNVALAGTYRLEVVVNGAVVGTEEVVFRQVRGSESAFACLDRTMLVRFGLDPARLPATQALPDTAICGDLDHYIPGASVDFDQGEQRLLISIPQAYMYSRARGYVSPEYWDAGENVAMLNYNTNTYSVRGRGDRATSTYIGASAGANLGGWRLRHTGALTLGNGRNGYQNNLTYAQHDLTDARAQLTVGDSYTSGELLDSVRVRGVVIASDQRMLPASQRGYAPVIRGVAESNANVVIRQRGYVIYNTTVAPGPFEIDDLYPTGYGGDIEVVITEADGRQRSIVVPFAAQPQLLREGTSRFSIAAGQVNELSVRDTPFILQATAQRGMTNIATLYGGITASNSYLSGMLGTAVNVPFGSLALDVTAARAPMRTLRTQNGLSTRLSYSKNLEDTDTNVGIAAYRFSTRGYLGVVDAARLRQDIRLGIDDERLGRERGRLDVNISQAVGRTGGRLMLSGSTVNYWNRVGKRVDYTLAYGNSWRSLTYSISAQRSRIGDPFGVAPFGSGQFGPDFGSNRRQDTTLFLTLSMPLGGGTTSPLLTSTLGRSDDGASNAQVGVTGQLGRNGDLSYGVSATRTSQDGASATNGNANAAWRSPVGVYRGSYGVGSSGRSQLSFGMTGAVVAHQDGITLAQELGETNAIIHAAGAEGARVESYQGVRLDSRGNAIVRSLMPYQMNTVSIDPAGSSTDVELASTSASVAPRAGAVVKLNFDTNVGIAVMIHALQADGKPLPFGASVIDGEGQAIGVVGQGSKAFVRGVPDGARLTVRWGSAAAEQCRIDLPASLADAPRAGVHRLVEARCVTDQGAR